MYTFILAVLVVSFISLCFFKKRFWENRYLVLLISASVVLVITLTTNFITRNKIGTHVEKIFEKKMMLIAYNSSLIDSTFFITNHKNLDLDDHEYVKDSLTKPVNSYYLLYYNDGALKIGCAVDGKWQYKYLKDVYLAPSTGEKVAYYSKEKKIYNKRTSKWTTNISLPRIETFYCFYLPPSEYAAIPDSLFTKLPI